MNRLILDKIIFKTKVITRSKGSFYNDKGINTSRRLHNLMVYGAQKQRVYIVGQKVTELKKGIKKSITRFRDFNISLINFILGRRKSVKI